MDIIEEHKKPHPIGKGVISQFELIPGFTMSCVGGAFGLHGDGEDTFEIAIINEKTGKFVQLQHYDSIIGHVDRQRIIDFVTFVKENKKLTNLNKLLGVNGNLSTIGL